jgi:hypothetical protein
MISNDWDDEWKIPSEKMGYSEEEEEQDRDE